jgi:hypothetical protein
MVAQTQKTFIMKNFRILHPVGGGLNTNMDRGLYEYEIIQEYFVAKSLNDVFRLTQNDFSKLYASLGRRSTSVGDIIIDLDENIHYMVAGRGFIEIPYTVAQYIDWGNHMEGLRYVSPEVGYVDQDEEYY